MSATSNTVQRTIGDYTVIINCAQKYTRAASSVLGEFEKLANTGVDVKAGTQMRFGWTLFLLEKHADGLIVTEPDFSVWPQARWSQTIDTSLKVLISQTGLLRRLNVSGEDAFYDQFIVVVSGSLSAQRVFLRRERSLSVDDSGWVLGTVDNPEALSGDIANFERHSIASLVHLRPSLLEAVSLPVGFIAVFSGAHLEQVLDTEGVQRL